MSSGRLNLGKGLQPIARADRPLSWKNGANDRSLSLRAPQIESTAVQLGQSLGKRQAEAGPLVATSQHRVNLAKRLHCYCDLMGSHADTIIGDCQDRLIASVAVRGHD